MNSIYFNIYKEVIIIKVHTITKYTHNKVIYTYKSSYIIYIIYIGNNNLFILLKFVSNPINYYYCYYCYYSYCFVYSPFFLGGDKEKRKIIIYGFLTA